MLLTNAKLFLGALWILKKENKHSVSLKPISNNTSNSHPEHIINNAFIRIQRNKAQHESSEESERTKSRISGSDNDMERNTKIHWYILICWKAFPCLSNIARKYSILSTWDTTFFKGNWTWDRIHRLEWTSVYKKRHHFRSTAVITKKQCCQMLYILFKDSTKTNTS